MTVQGRVRHKESGELGQAINSGKNLTMVRWDDPTKHKMLTPTELLEEVEK